MKPLDRYLNSIREKIEAEARAEVDGLEQVLDHDEFRVQVDAAIENITDAYAEGFCDDRSARMYGDYPYDGSFADQEQEGAYIDEVGETC